MGFQETEKTCLVVDDDREWASLLAILIEPCGYKVTVGNSLNEGLIHLNKSYRSKQLYDLVVTDGFLKWLPEEERTLQNIHGRIIARAAKIQALSLARKYPEHGFRPPTIVLISGNDHINSKDGREYLGGHGIVAAHGKPIDIREIEFIADHADLLRPATVGGRLAQGTFDLFKGPSRWHILTKEVHQETIVG